MLSWSHSPVVLEVLYQGNIVYCRIVGVLSVVCNLSMRYLVYFGLFRKQQSLCKRETSHAKRLVFMVTCNECNEPRTYSSIAIYQHYLYMSTWLAIR